MSVGRGWRRLLRLPGTPERDVDDEIAFHVAMRAATLERHGVPAEEARIQALASFGDPTRIRTEVLVVERQYARQSRLTGWLTSLWSDIRYATRTLSRAPTFTAGAVLALGLGLGATTAIFSVVDGVLLRPLPYPQSDRIIRLFSLKKDGQRGSLSEPDFQDWRRGTRSFTGMAQFQSLGQVTVNGLSEPIRANTATVSRDFFPVFGLRPELGRTFATDETVRGGPPAAVVSDGFWKRQLGGRPSAVGTGLVIDGRRYTVVGVMPSAMDYPPQTEVWLPHEIDEPNLSRSSGGWRVIARLRPTVGLDRATHEVRALSQQIAHEYGAQTFMTDAALEPLQDQLVGGVRAALLVAAGAATFLLLIACANVTNLLVARLATRRSEIGVRFALGASRGRIASQLFVEAGVLAVAGGMLGVALASAGVRGLLALQSGTLPRAGEVHVDWSVLIFAAALSGCCSIAVGLLAAWQGTRGAIRTALSSSERTQAGSGGTAGVRRALTVSQMALTVVLLVGAAVLGRSFLRVMAVDPGYRTQHVLVLDAPIPYEGDSSATIRMLFYRQMMARIAGVPGVASVGASTSVPLGGGGSDGEFLILHSTGDPVRMEDWDARRTDPARSGYANFDVVAGDYFRAMGIPLVRGRTFDRTDTPNTPHVAIISASLARATWPHDDPIGKVVDFGNMDGDVRPATIVGIVGDVRSQALAVDALPTLYAYEPQRPNAAGNLSVTVQTMGEPTSVVTAARAIVREMRPDVPVTVRTIESAVADSVADRRFMLALVAAFAVAALLLATLGVYSVISYLVSQRRKEIGVRLALGARPADILGLILRQGALLASLGILVGTAGAFALTRVLRGLVYGVSPTDPLAFGAVVVLLAGVAVLASWLPARRAARVDPAGTLRDS